MPVQCATTSATSSSETSSFSIFTSAWSSASRAFSVSISFWSSTILPYRSSAARSRSPSRSARSASARASSICDFSVRMRSIRSFSCCQCAFMPAERSCRSASSRLEAFEPLLRGGVGLLAQRRPLDLELLDTTLDLVDLDRHRIDLDPQSARSLVDQVDRLVGQEPSADVAVARAPRPQRARGPGSGRRGAPRSAPSDRAGSRSCPRRSARPTSTGWNRRSRAGSFSMCSRYSSSVVAPIARSSPRASIGFSMLPASIAPSAAPAPTIVWSSSMKVMISPLALGDLAEHRLQALLELAAVLRAGDHRAEVERHHPLVPSATRGHRRRRCAARAPRRSRSCRRRARRSAPGCSSSGGRGPGSRGGPPRRGRSPGRACRGGPCSVRSRPYFSRTWYLSSGV